MTMKSDILDVYLRLDVTNKCDYFSHTKDSNDIIIGYYSSFIICIADMFIMFIRNKND